MLLTGASALAATPSAPAPPLLNRPRPPWPLARNRSAPQPSLPPMQPAPPKLWCGRHLFQLSGDGAPAQGRLDADGGGPTRAPGANAAHPRHHRHSRRHRVLAGGLLPKPDSAVHRALPQARATTAATLRRARAQRDCAESCRLTVMDCFCEGGAILTPANLQAWRASVLAQPGAPEPSHA